MAEHRTGPGGLVRLGIATFTLGLVAIVVTFAAYADGAHNRPVWQNLLCMLAPLGFGLAAYGLVRDGRAEARSAEARLNYPSTD